MIYCAINDENRYTAAVDSVNFPDRTFGGSLCRSLRMAPNRVSLAWLYDGDRELFQLKCIVDTIRADYGDVPISLFLPYIPNARMDRVKNRGQLLTIKSFANVINSMHFSKVTVIDPHSDVSTALIDRVSAEEYASGELLTKALIHTYTDGRDSVVCYPDAGSAKRFGALTIPTVTCEKVRDFNTGKIESVKLIGDVDLTDKNVFIVDDICSYGGTFHAAAKALKAAGANRIVLVVSHCEDSILKGKLFDPSEARLINMVFTTDSIFRGHHPQIVVHKLINLE